MTEHTRTDGLPALEPSLPAAGTGGAAGNARVAGSKIACNACPVLCQISPGRTGACDRYANQDGWLVRLDPVVALQRTLAGDHPQIVAFASASSSAVPSPASAPAAGSARAGSGTVPAAGGTVTPLADNEPAAPRTNAGNTAAPEAPAGNPAAGRADTDDRTNPVAWNGDLLRADQAFITGVGASTTYPDYKPAPFIIASAVDGVDLVTVVTEGIFSYCSFKLKIDTDRYLGPEQANVRCQGEIVGHVTTAEYGSQMLSLGGVHHLTGGSRKEGRITAATLEALGNRQAVDLTIDGGTRLTVQAGVAPIVDGVREQRMRVGCGSAAIGMFAQQFCTVVDEVVVVDDHITGVLTEHQAGRCLDMPPSGIELRGRRSTPGRYFQVANPGTGWGGTDLTDPLTILGAWDARVAWPGLRLLMTSTTGEHAGWFVLDERLQPVPAPMPAEVRAIVERIGENCEPSLTSVLFLGGAGGSLRAGVTTNPVQLTRAIKRSLVNVTVGGAPAYVWPGGGITVMADVLRMPANAFGTVPTPAIVAPIEFTLRQQDYLALGGHAGHIRSWAQVLRDGSWHGDGAPRALQWQAAIATNAWPAGTPPMLG